MSKFLQVSSWNMQGGGLNKLQYVLPKKSNDRIIQFCQESGVPQKTGFKSQEYYNNYICLSALVDEKALNQRCTTSCLITANMSGVIYQNNYQCGVNRPIVGCGILNSNWIFCTYHATASRNYSVSEVKMIIEFLNNTFGCNSKWILIGDFNSLPCDYDLDGKNLFPNTPNLIRISSTKSRARNEDMCYVVYDKNPTQGLDGNGNRENYLDYAFMSAGVVKGMHFTEIKNQMIFGENGEIVSDHNRITLELNMDVYM